jgi:AAHS family 4-hydroxybenzoate transporter-like MFS transporter
MPNATALTSEYVPLKSRVFLISLMFCGVALGALIAGFTAPALIAAFGWRSIFLVGGVVPLFIAAALYVWIPESLRLLVAQRPADPRIAGIVARFLPGVEAATVIASASDRVERQNVLELFAPRYRARTALLWAAFALNLFVLFVLISWLPAVLTAAGWTPAQALRGAVVNQAGGIVGGLVIAWLVDRDKTVPALIGGYVLVAAALSLFLVVPSNVTSWVVLLVVVGAGISGAQVALNALSAVFYPPSLRANGAGWANTIGRTGALLAPLAGGFVIARFTLEPAQQLTLLIAPVLLCGACAALLPYVWRGERPASAGAIGAQRSAAEPLG